MGPDPAQVRSIADRVLAKAKGNSHVRQANEDWSERAPTAHFILDQDRLRLIGLTSNDASQQIQFLLTGVPVTQVREDIRTVDVVARTLGPNRLDPTKLLNMTLTNSDGRLIPLSQVGSVEVREEDPILKRRDRLPTITVQSELDDSLQPPQVTAEIAKAIQAMIDKLPDGYKIEVGANTEESAKANTALAAVFPIMIVCMLVVIIFQVRSLPGTGDDGLNSTARFGGRGSYSPHVSSALRFQLHPRVDCSGRNSDAKHADSDRPDQDESRRRS